MVFGIICIQTHGAQAQTWTPPLWTNDVKNQNHTCKILYQDCINNGCSHINTVKAVGKPPDAPLSCYLFNIDNTKDPAGRKQKCGQFASQEQNSGNCT